MHKKICGKLVTRILGTCGVFLSSRSEFRMKSPYMNKIISSATNQATKDFILLKIQLRQTLLCLYIPEERKPLEI